MAREIRIPGSEGTAKIRLWAVALPDHHDRDLLLLLVVLHPPRAARPRAHKEHQRVGDSPGTSLLAVTLGALIIVPALVSIYRGFKRVQAAQRLMGSDPINGWIGLILFIVITPAFYAYVQSGLNPVWERLGVLRRRKPPRPRRVAQTART